MKVWNWTVARLTFCRFCMEGGDGSNKSPMHSWDLAVKWIKGTTYLLKAQGWKADAPICRTEGSKKSNTWEPGPCMGLENMDHMWTLRPSQYKFVKVIYHQNKNRENYQVISSKDSSIGVFLCGRLNWLEDWLRLRLQKICDLCFQLFCGGARVLVLANFAFFAVFSFASDHPMFGHV